MAEDRPTERDWQARGEWFEATLQRARGRSAAEVGEHAAALLIELETVFRAGAWIATVVLAATVVEVHLRERLASEGRAASPYLNAQDLFLEGALGEDYDWLRRHRNRLVHYADEPYLTPDMHWFQADELEEDARRSISLAADALYRPLP